MQREKIEQFAFLYLCGVRDRRLLSGKEKMTFSDFDRLIYITSVLGLIHYNLKMWDQYSMQFQAQLEIQERLAKKRSIPLDQTEYEDDIKQQEQWLVEFCENAPDHDTREYLRGIVDKADE